MSPVQEANAYLAEAKEIAEKFPVKNIEKTIESPMKVTEKAIEKAIENSSQQEIKAPENTTNIIKDEKATAKDKASIDQKPTSNPKKIFNKILRKRGIKHFNKDSKKENGNENTKQENISIIQQSNTR